jgi:tRNA(Ile)-lysidine synthase
METIQEKVRKNLQKLLPAEKKSSVLAALSGGKDSMSLLNILLELRNELKIDISVCYVNHNLRGDESAEEEAFVTNYIGNLKLPFYKINIDKNKWENLKRESVEMAARRYRYDFFNKTASEHNINFIITAHNLNDNIETLFLRLLRSGGVDSLSGIPVKNRNIIRPFLNVSRKEIEEYIRTKALPYYEDSSNKKDIYKRNMIRNRVIPVLSDIQPGFEKNLERMIFFFREEKAFLHRIVNAELKKLTVYRSEFYFALSKNKFRLKPVFLQKQVIKLILIMLGRPARPDKSLFSSLLNTKKINYYKNDFQCIERGEILWYINKNKIRHYRSSLQINDIPSFAENNEYTIEIKKSTVNDFYRQPFFDAEKVIFPVYLRPLEKDDTIMTVTSIKIKKILKNMKIPQILFSETVILSDAKKVIGFFLNGIFRISKEFYINDTEKEHCTVKIIKKK